MLNSQFAAVHTLTALARIREGNISAGYVHDVGPHVVANVATNRYEHTTIPHDAPRWPTTTQLMSLLSCVAVAAVLGRP